MIPQLAWDILAYVGAVLWVGGLIMVGIGTRRSNRRAGFRN